MVALHGRGLGRRARGLRLVKTFLRSFRRD